VFPVYLIADIVSIHLPVPTRLPTIGSMHDRGHFGVLSPMLLQETGIQLTDLFLRPFLTLRYNNYNGLLLVSFHMGLDSGRETSNVSHRKQPVVYFVEYAVVF
jgi:hypothetical protein